MKKWLVGLIVVIVLAGGIYVLYRAGILLEGARKSAVIQLSQILQREVAIGKISTNFFTRITARNVKIAGKKKLNEGIFFSAEKVIIYFSLWNLIRNRKDFIKSLRKIYFFKPELFLKHSGGKWNFPVLQNPAQRKTLPIQVGIRSGQVNLTAPSQKFDKISLTKIDAFCDLNNLTEIPFSITAKTNQSPDDRLSGEGSINLPEQKFNLALTLEKGNFKNFFALISAKPGAKAKNFDLNLTVLGEIKKFYLTSNLQIDDSQVKLKGSVTRGEGKRFKPFMDLKGSCENFQLAVLHQLFDYSGLKDLNGKAQAEFALIGSGNDWKAVGEASFDSIEMKGVKIERLQTKFAYARPILKLSRTTARLYGGEFSSSIHLDFRPPGRKGPGVSANFQFTQLSLDKLLKLPKPPLLAAKKIHPVKGKINCKGYLKGKLPYPQITAEITTTPLSWNGQKLAPVKATVRYSEAKVFSFKLGTLDQNYVVSTTFRPKDKQTLLCDCAFLLAKRGRITMQGSIGPPKDFNFDLLLNLTIDGKEIEFRDIPYFNYYYPDSSGQLNFQAKITGSTRGPQAKLTIYSQNMQINQQLLNLKTNLSIGRKFLRIDSLNINNTYSMKGEFAFRPGGICKGEIKCKAGDLRTIFALTKIPVQTGQGKVNGKINLEGTFSNPTIAGKIDLVRAEVYSFPFEKAGLNFALANHALILNPSRIVQKGGSLTIKGRAGLKKKTANKFRFFIQTAKFSPLKSMCLDGKIVSNGLLKLSSAVSVEGKIYSTNLTVNEVETELGSRFVCNQKGLQVMQFSLKPGISGRGEVEFIAPPKVDFSLQVNTDKLESFLRIAKLKLPYSPGGKLSGGVKLTGELKKPDVKARFKLARGNFGGVKFYSPLTAFSFSGGKLQIDQASLCLVPRGEILLSGGIDFSSPQPLDLQLNLTNGLRIDSFSSFVPSPEKLKIGGEVHGEVILSGELNNPLVNGNLICTESNINQYQLSEVMLNFVYQDRVVKFERLRAEDKSQQIFLLSRGSKIYFQKPQELEFVLFSGVRNVRLKGVTFFGDLLLKGKIQNLAKDWELSASGQTRDLWVNEHNFENTKFQLQALHRSGSGQANRTSIKFIPVKEQLYTLSGEVKFADGSYRTDGIFILYQDKPVFELKGEISPPQFDLAANLMDIGTDAQVLVDLANLKIQAKGSTTLSVIAKGSLDEPRITCALNISRGEFGGLDFDHFSTLIKVEGNAIYIKQFSLVKEGVFHLVAKGGIPYKKQVREENIDLSLKTLPGDLALLKAVSPRLKKVEGPLDLNLKISGSIEKPILNGWLKVEKGVIYPPEIVKVIKDLNIDIEIVDNAVQIKTLRAEVDRGYFDFRGELELAGAKPFLLSGVNLYLNIPEDKPIVITVPSLMIPYGGILPKQLSEAPSRIGWSGGLRLCGTSREPKLTGEVEFSKGWFTWPPEKGGGELPELFKKFGWDVKLKFGKNLHYVNRNVNVLITGWLTLKGEGKDLKVNGQIIPQGEVSYLGMKFKIQEAGFEVKDNQPYINARLLSTIRYLPEGLAERPENRREDQIVIEIPKSKLSEIMPTFKSHNDPDLKQDQIVSRLTGLDVRGQDLNVLLKRSMLKLVSDNLASPFIKSLVKRTGWIDVVELGVDERAQLLREAPIGPVSLQMLIGTQFTLGKYINDRLYLGYNVELIEGARRDFRLRHEVEFTYRIQKNFYLKGIYSPRTPWGEEERAVYVGDRWFFGWPAK